MFFIILGTYTRWTFIIFSLVQRILLLIFQCHTVTHGTDLRRSPLWGEDEGGGRGAAARRVHQAHQLLRGLAAGCRGTSRGGFSSKILSEVIDVTRARWRPFLLHDLHALCVLCILLSFLRDFNDVLQI